MWVFAGLLGIRQPETSLEGLLNVSAGLNGCLDVLLAGWLDGYSSHPCFSHWGDMGGGRRGGQVVHLNRLVKMKQNWDRGRGERTGRRVLGWEERGGMEV